MDLKKHKFFMVMLACLGSLAVSAQIVQKVGNNSMTISQSAAFEIESTDRGFLPPRLTDTQLAGITSPAVGLFVFNTTSAVLQYFNGIRWISLIDAANSAYVTAYNCSIGSAGTLTSGTPASGVTQTIKASVAKLGTYSITTAPVNGVTFSGSGVYTVTGDQNIVLTATGTPTTIGAITNALSGTPTCSFSRMIIDGTSAVTGYACGTASAGSMIPGTPVSGVTQTITAAVSRVGPYSITTTAINGVTFTASGTYPTTGQQNITLTASGTPTVSGTFTYDISGATTCSFSRNTVSGVTTVASSTGKVWIDRNLGATQVATSSTDAASYGDLYQWGRLADGHQLINRTTSQAVNGSTTTLSPGDVPGNGSFITNSTSPSDWRQGQNPNLWQGVNGINNPCPAGFRLPTSAELEAERVIFSPNNAAGAFASVLKLPMAGGRFYNSGSIYDVGISGGYWSSTVSGINASFLYFDSSTANMPPYSRGFGGSVRCLKD